MNTIEINKIIIPDGWEVAEVNGCEITLRKRQDALPTTWEEFCKTHPVKTGEAYIDEGSSVEEIGEVYVKRIRLPKEDANLLPDCKTAEAVLALCKLIQLRDCYRQGWKPDWYSEEDKYVIQYCEDKDINVLGDDCHSNVLAFETEKLAEKFLHNFRELIEKAKELI